MSDIVEKLRKLGKLQASNTSDTFIAIGTICNDAADEIERHRIAAKLQLDMVEKLRNEVRKLAGTLSGIVNYGPSFAEIKQNKNVLVLDGSRGE